MSSNIKFDSENYYAYIGIFKDKDYKAQTLLLDANTAINLEKFYFNPSKLILKDKNYGDKDRNKKWKSTAEFLIDNIDKDIIYGLALQESCWDYNLKCLNKNQYKKMETAIEAQYDWNYSYILKHSYSIGNKDNFKVVRKKPNRISTLTDQLECNPEILSSYACVLKIMILQRTMQERSRIKNYISFIDFMNEELIGIHAIEANIATNYFLGNPEMQEIGDKIFKFGKQTSVLLNAWNTCWDIFYLRFLQRLYFDEKLQAYNPKLVTADIGIINLARMTSLEAVVDDKEGYMTVLSFYDSDIKEEFIQVAKDLEEQLYFSAMKRKEKRAKIKNRMKHVIDIVINLEEELLCLYNEI